MSNSLGYSVAVVVDKPLAEAWALLADYSLPHNYVPGLTRTEIVSAASSGPGAHRRVYTGDRYLEETIIDWREGQGFTLRLHRKGKPMAPFKNAEFDYQLQPEDAQRTRVTLALRFVLPLGRLGGFLGRNLVLPEMKKQLVAVAAGMKHFYETGTAAADEDRQRLAGSVETHPASG
ncbi:SRPBCC family protein [Seongchinamella sediminis]|uniref:SRPBCC family protein n=1 Tax=Seongchinamella sediminis TaxID=2283635 RepID=A0A3L7DTC1_9GAMM|nr:SRPBCC family protein [Seongchinamella sediminis]RLQ20808.1 SRPBCC family protein [Seongchinamella sediminis]